MKKHNCDFLRRFGNQIKRIRISKNMSQEKLALEAGLDRSYVGQVERGERNPSLKNVKRIAEAMNVSLSNLMEGL